MKKKTIATISIILTLSTIMGFAVGPMVNTQAPQLPATRSVGPLAQALQDYRNVFENGKDVIITGTITNIVYGNGRMPVELTVKTDDSNSQTVTVELGPIWMFNATELVLNTPVKIQGRKLNDKMIAYQITFNKDQLVQLRNNEGLPVWAGAMGNSRRFDKRDLDQLKDRVRQYLQNRQGQRPNMPRPPVQNK